MIFLSFSSFSKINRKDRIFFNKKQKIIIFIRTFAISILVVKGYKINYIFIY
jgi:hypothetical protein